MWNGWIGSPLWGGACSSERGWHWQGVGSLPLPKIDVEPRAGIPLEQEWDRFRALVHEFMLEQVRYGTNTEQHDPVDALRGVGDIRFLASVYAETAYDLVRDIVGDQALRGILTSPVLIDRWPWTVISTRRFEEEAFPSTAVTDRRQRSINTQEYHRKSGLLSASPIILNALVYSRDTVSPHATQWPGEVAFGDVVEWLKRQNGQYAEQMAHAVGEFGKAFGSPTRERAFGVGIAIAGLLFLADGQDSAATPSPVRPRTDLASMEYVSIFSCGAYYGLQDAMALQRFTRVDGSPWPTARIKCSEG
jgi:hypothetical protein